MPWTIKGKTQNVSNDEAGIRSLLATIRMAPSGPGTMGGVVLEAAGGFEREAAVALCSAGMPVMVVNPRQARDFAKADGVFSQDQRDGCSLYRCLISCVNVSVVPAFLPSVFRLLYSDPPLTHGQATDRVAAGRNKV